MHHPTKSFKIITERSVSCNTELCFLNVTSSNVCCILIWLTYLSVYQWTSSYHDLKSISIHSPYTYYFITLWCSFVISFLILFPLVDTFHCSFTSLPPIKQLLIVRSLWFTLKYVYNCELQNIVYYMCMPPPQLSIIYSWHE